MQKIVSLLQPNDYLLTLLGCMIFMYNYAAGILEDLLIGLLYGR